MNSNNNTALKALTQSKKDTLTLVSEESLQARCSSDLGEIAAQAIICLKAQRCSILLFTESHSGCLGVSYCANFPHSVTSQVTPLEQAIATYLSETGQSLIIKNSKFLPFPRPKVARFKSTSLLAVPLFQNNQMMGAIIVEHPEEKKYFEETDLDLLSLFAKIASQTLHIAYLQNILKSKFVTLAVAREIQETQEADPHPTKLAKIVAKSFFREVTQAGFSPPQIIETATEVLHLLHLTLAKHRQRLSRDD
ncbi:GAF domain-containing protein [Aphanothece hegewaldii CCALA 016]|uniref:GAF domain-containing protein n=1 Tax=Aphanothece hegewaldii CCALA 016 TaxID=2107694 RepID=A0A2T1M121_9CHRO|nr:GAF domain-containing protein [Aphanothece hegewaldii]PSF38364.1 GAF domain-containing protein [Aphanothece hegewaldii CCALA 016]